MSRSEVQICIDNNTRIIIGAVKNVSRLLFLRENISAFRGFLGGDRRELRLNGFGAILIFQILFYTAMVLRFKVTIESGYRGKPRF